jgi:hypothetical protein
VSLYRRYKSRRTLLPTAGSTKAKVSKQGSEQISTSK